MQGPALGNLPKVAYIVMWSGGIRPLGRSMAWGSIAMDMSARYAQNAHMRPVGWPFIVKYAPENLPAL